MLKHRCEYFFNVSWYGIFRNGKSHANLQKPEKTEKVKYILPRKNRFDQYF